MTRHSNDPNQTAFDFEAKIEQYAEITRDIMDYKRPTIRREATTEGFDSLAEFHIEVAAMLKRAIRGTGLSREQVLDRYNEYWGLTDSKAGPDGKRPLTINMLNNYLSKPAENPAPMRLAYAIVAVCQSGEIPDLFARLIGHVTISWRQSMLTQLGEIHELSLRASNWKRQLLKEFRGQMGDES